jgi:hypothetical protein
MYRHQSKKQEQLTAIIKASRRKSREEEIAMHNKPLTYNKIVLSKKIYSRKMKHNSEEE